LEYLDYTGPLTYLSGAEKAITGTGLIYTLPANRRGDTGYEPWGRGLVGDVWQETGVALAGDEVTLTAISGATVYQVLWFPAISVLVEGGLQIDDDLREAESIWQLSLIEI
jgi:hypothetical protein